MDVSRAETRRRWQERLARFTASTLTVAQFCAAEQVSVASFYLWRRRLCELASAESPKVDPVPASRLLPVMLTEDGRLTIDNNASERTLRLQAIGHKNWLFLGSERGGGHRRDSVGRAAVLFSVLASAKRHYVEPWAYLRDVLSALSESPADLTPLLPDVWLQANPDKRLEYRKRESEQAQGQRA